MRNYIRAKDIPADIRKQLPNITPQRMKERFCSCCPFFAGTYEGEKKCMGRICAWEDNREMLHPALLQMYGRAVAKMKDAQKEYELRKRTVQLLEKLKEEEEQEQQRKNDKCYQCIYARSGPCIGICYAELAEFARRKGEKNHEQSNASGETGEGSQL